jgi:hypothetical protein
LLNLVEDLGNSRLLGNFKKGRAVKKGVRQRVPEVGILEEKEAEERLLETQTMGRAKEVSKRRGGWTLGT